MGTGGVFAGINILNNLEYGGTQHYRGANYVTFNQTVNGVRVYEAQWKVHVRSGGTIDMVIGTYYPGLQASTNPAVSQASAVAAARSNLTGSFESLDTKAELVIYNNKGKFSPVWKVVSSSPQPDGNCFILSMGAREK